MESKTLKLEYNSLVNEFKTTYLDKNNKVIKPTQSD